MQFDPADVPIPGNLRDDPAFREQWADWLYHLADKHRHPSRAQCKLQLAQLSEAGARRATQALIEHITAGWLTLDVTREPSRASGQAKSGRPRRAPRLRPEDLEGGAA